jgi:hypothetical protein
MPTINLFYQNQEHEPQLEAMTDPLKEYVAEQLTCEDITLGSDEVSVRLLRSLGKGMLADVEMDITAAPYAERVEKQDEICLNVRKFTMDQIPDVADVKVWLNLHELGHSWE